MLVSRLIPVTVAGFLMFGIADQVSLILRLYDEPTPNLLDISSTEPTNEEKTEIGLVYDSISSANLNKSDDV